jgi:Holliday junction DNA helicase RuvA
MISLLIGQPIIEKDFLTVLCGQVGYAVKVTTAVMAEAARQSEVKLHIYTHVKEEALELYGFSTTSDREMFLLLISVSGVGPKTAMHILDSGASQIVEAVQQANVSFFSATPRVGKKLAQKIIIDLRTKLGSMKELDLKPLSPERQEVTLALQTLGFDEQAIVEAVKLVDVEALTSGEAVKQAIKLISKR